MNTQTSGAADLPEALRIEDALNQADRAEAAALSYGEGTTLGIEAYAAAKTIRALHSRLAALAAGQAVAPAVSDAELQEAHRLGFLRAAGWVQRDDLFSDVGSPTYRKDRDHDLSTIRATRPAPPAMDGGDAEDAARYRWLRAPTTDVALVLDKRTAWVPPDDVVPGVGGYWSYEYRAGDELDAAIDAARAAQKEAEKP